MGDLYDIFIVAGAVVLALVGLCMALNLFGVGDRVIRGGTEEKAFAKRNEISSLAILFMPTTRAGARRMGIALFVLFGFGVYLQLTGQ